MLDPGAGGSGAKQYNSLGIHCRKETRIKWRLAAFYETSQRMKAKRRPIDAELDAVALGDCAYAGEKQSAF